MCENCNTCSDSSFCPVFDNPEEQQEEMVCCYWCGDYFEPALIEDYKGKSYCPDCLEIAKEDDRLQTAKIKELVNCLIPA